MLLLVLEIQGHAPRNVQFQLFQRQSQSQSQSCQIDASILLTTRIQTNSPTSATSSGPSVPPTPTSTLAAPPSYSPPLPMCVPSLISHPFPPIPPTPIPPLSLRPPPPPCSPFFPVSLRSRDHSELTLRFRTATNHIQSSPTRHRMRAGITVPSVRGP
jgi:hypothetical protein